MPLFEDLLSRGYLPIQLPPGFSSTTMASSLSAYGKAWNKLKKIPWTAQERFSVARSSYYRRNTSLVNPISFYALARVVAECWPNIETHYAKTPLSRSIPKEGGALRAIDLSRFSSLYEEKIKASSGYKYALLTDITAYFPTIYTHTIPWALHTKPVAKQHQEQSATYFGNILDAKCRGCQEGQTIGLPIGPDTSHIIAEIIGVAIDERLQAGMGAWPAGFRYVDDFVLFFNERAEADRALAVVNKAVSSMELQLNAAKTKVIEARELVEESWKYAAKRLRIASERREQRDDIHHYFETILALEKKHKEESLVKYGLKRLCSTIIKKSNWPIFEAYLLKCGFAFPNTLQVLVHLLATYRHHGYALNQEAIGRFCNRGIEQNATSDRHGEVAWLLWLAKELSVAIEPDVAKEVAKMQSSVCRLILMDLASAGLTSNLSDLFNMEHLASLATSATLLSSEWLMAYEAGRRKWLGNADLKYILTHSFFGPLLRAKVYFYHEDTNLPPLFTLKNDWLGISPVDFDGDASIDNAFEFDEMDEEYTDVGGTKETAKGEGDNNDDGDDDDDDDDTDTDF